MENMVRIVVIDVSNIYSSEVYDEAIFPIKEKDEASRFLQQYVDITKYRIITV